MKNVDFAWLLKLIQRHLRLFTLGLLLGLAVATAAYKVISPKYKSIAKISVSPRYFQSPMMRDFLPEIYDPSELKAERETALAAILTPEFLARLSNTQAKQGLEQAPPDPAQIELLRKSFEILRENATTFQIAALAKTSARAHELVSRYLQQVETDLSATRLAFIRRLRDSVRGRIQSLSPNVLSLEPSAPASTSEIGRLKQQRQELLSQFKPGHPAVAALDARLKQLGSTDTADATAAAPTTSRSSGSDPSIVAPQDIKNRLLEDLLRKYEMLEIVLDLEQSDRSGYVTVVSAPSHPLGPVSPQPVIFIAWGLVVGLLLGTGLVLWRHQQLAAQAGTHLAREREKAAEAPSAPIRKPQYDVENSAIFTRMARPEDFLERPIDAPKASPEANA